MTDQTAIELAPIRDEDLWRSVLSGLPASDIALDWRWGDLITRTYGWEPIRLVARLGGRTLGAIQVHRFPLGLKRMALSSPFLTTGSPALDGSFSPSDFYQALGRAAKSLDLRHIDIRDVADPVTDMPSEAEEWTFRLTLRHRTPEALLASFSAKLRSQIKKPTKDGYRAYLVEDGTLRFYEPFQRKMHEFGTPVHSRRLFTHLLSELPDATRQFIVIDPDGRTIGGMLMLIAGSTASIPFAVVHEPERRSAANMLLYYEALAHACSMGVTEVDFGRSQRDSGTYRFKLQWGSRPLPLVNRRCSAQGVSSTSLGIRGAMAREFTSWWSQLPGDLADRLGPGLRGYIP